MDDLIYLPITGEVMCKIEGCVEPTVVAYVNDDNRSALHPDEHWADGYPRLPNTHNSWWPLSILRNPVREDD
jgi:hypothetical protein